MKKVKWRWDYGVYVPLCPHCNELAYERDHCVFCKQPYQWVEGKHKYTTVNVGEYTVVQGTSNSIFIYKGDRAIMHASCTEKKTEDELRDMIAYYEKVARDEE